MAIPAIKRLGEILLESGVITDSALGRCLEISQKNAMPLGKVLVMQKCCKEEDVKDAIKLQSLSKFETLPNALIIEAMVAARDHRSSIQEALQHIGWYNDHLSGAAEPEDLKEARTQLMNIEALNGITSNEFKSACLSAADIYLKYKWYCRAEACYLKYLAVLEKLQDKANKIAILIKLADTVSMQKRGKEALIYLEEAAEITRQVYGTPSVQAAEVLAGMGRVKEKLRKFGEASNHYLQSLLILDSVLPITDPLSVSIIRALAHSEREQTRTAPDKISLGQLLVQSYLADDKQISYALQYGRDNDLPLGRALVASGIISEHILQEILQVQIYIRNGKMSAFLAAKALQFAYKSGLSLGQAIKELECFANHIDEKNHELQDLSDQILQIEKTQGADTLAIAPLCINLADKYFQRSQFLEAESLFKRASNIFFKTKGEEALETLECLDKLVEIYINLEDLEEASKLLKSIIQIRYRVYGQKSLPVARSLEIFARCYSLRGDYTNAAAWLDRAIAIKVAILPPDNTELAGTYEGRGDCAFEMLDFNMAAECLRKSIEIRLRAGEHKTELMPVVNRLLEAYGQTSNHVQAEILKAKFGLGNFLV